MFALARGSAFPRSYHVNLGAIILNALAAHRQRKALAKLDDHLLCDIGVTAKQATSEATKPFWDAPNHWKL